MLLVVEIIDAATQCWIDQKQLVLRDLPQLVSLLNLEDFQFNAVYDLEPADLRLLEGKYEFSLSDRHLDGKLAVFEREEFFPVNSHTGRELLLMLVGTKPLAVFSEEYPLSSGNPVSFIPEARFDPHVEAGRFIKRADITKRAGVGGVRRVLYALPEQEWRIEAYLMLWALCDKHGWNPGYEAIEGYLLGYETEIDGFFARGNE